MAKINRTKILNSQYKSKLKELKKFGIYEPAGNQLTKHRKSVINKRYNEYKEQIESNKLIFVKYPKQAKNLWKKAKGLDMQTTKKGVFIEKEGQRKAKIEYNKKFGTYEIQLTGKTQTGRKGIQKTTLTIPLTKQSEILTQLERMQNEADAFTLKDNEYFRIRVTELGNDGFSDSIFENFEMLKNHLEKYEKKLGDRIQFYRHIKIEKVSRKQHKIDRDKKEAKREFTKKRKHDRKGRSI